MFHSAGVSRGRNAFKKGSATGALARAVESESESRSRKDFQSEESESKSQKILTTPTPGRPFAHQL